MIDETSKSGGDANISKHGLPLVGKREDTKALQVDYFQQVAAASQANMANLDNNDAPRNERTGVDFAEEVRMQIACLPLPRWTLLRSAPGAYSVEGPGFAMSRIQHDTESIHTNNEESNDTTLDAELVQEDMAETGMATSDTTRIPKSDLIVDAQILPDKIHGLRADRLKSKLVCTVACLAISVAAILLSIFLVPDGSSSSSYNAGVHSESSSSVEQPPRFTVYPPFQDTLPTVILHGLGDPSSLFYSANRWMLDDANLSSYTSERQRQRFFLAMLYFATSGDHWLHRDHWMSYNTSECQWYSHSSLEKDSAYYVPSVCNKNESLISLSLAHNNLTGSIPIFPDLILPHLRVFDIGNNSIGGTSPPVVSSPSLEVVILSDNDFSESWKAGGGMFESNLKVVKSNGNRLRSGIPNNDAFVMSGMHRSIEVWNTSDNLFDGTVPTEIGLCTKLIYYGRGDNGLIGTLPSELGLLTGLQGMDYGGNSLMNGTIPAELGDLTALRHLDIAGTAISGSIPMNLCERVKEGSLKIEANCSLLDCCW